ncbi:MAG: trimeric intracellular cation channel family protein [Verrucomicrobiales bacterium]
MDFIGVFSIALIVSFGGGTLRDLLLDRHPIFWIGQMHYSVIIFVLALVTSLIKKIPQRIEKWLPVPDALGMAFYSILGTGFALEAGVPWFVAVLLGVVTGTFGGVIGDVVCNRIPSLFRPNSPLYASCSFFGSWVFVLLKNMTTVGDTVATWTGVSVVVLLRLLSLRLNWRLPSHG